MSVDFNASFSGSAETFGAKMTETPASMTASMKETGGGSASNYEALRNKPKINGHELIGDMTPAQLGITDDRHHTHKQAQAAKVWTVAHNLGKRPAVTVVDSAGTVVIGEVDYLDDNTVRLTFCAAFSGTAYFAKELGVHHTTIYRELKRCTYEHLNSDYTTETRYNPEGAQARYEANLRAKGPELKIGNDYELADYLIAKIRDEKYSPEAAIGEAEVKGWPFKTHICASTAYNYIRGEIFGDELTVSMLPQHGKRHQPERPAGSMPRKPAGRSIEDRPEHINDRSTFGHWEMDSVESCQGVSNTYIVMTERKTRREIIIPSPDKTSASVVAALDTLEKKVGSKVFPLIFQSITCDNGCEFADAAGIERSITGRGPRTEVYYCHPYRPSERGSNENQNGLIRRHLPKGTDLSTISYEETKRIEDWLNNYPRKMFGYLCSEQLFREEIALILAS